MVHTSNFKILKKAFKGFEWDGRLVPIFLEQLPGEQFLN